jgi:uncharacterized membrane protein YoaK (UPF0700 family)
MSRRRVPLSVLAAALTFGTGAVDVVAYLRLGESFASVMTGNLVLLGLAAAQRSAALAVHTVVALAGCAVGVGIGTRIAGRPRPGGPDWPPGVTAALLVELGVLAGFSVGWELTRGRPSGWVQLTLLAVAALGMGVQTAAVRGLPAAPSTTYLTGALTGLIATLTSLQRPRSADRRALAVVGAATCGAAAGGVLLTVLPQVLPALPLGALVATIATARLTNRPAPGKAAAEAQRPTDAA